MDFDKILNDLKNKIYKPIYLFYGEESYFIDILTDYIQSKVLDESDKAFNQTVVYGKDTNVVDIIEAARRYPMMSNIQVVILKEAQDLKNFKMLESYVVNPLNTTILVLSFKNTKSLDKRLKVNSLISKQGVVFESKKLYERDTYIWINENLKKNNLTIEQDALILFYENIGSDLSRLASEITKLSITHANHKQPITKEIIANNIGINREYNIYELQKTIGLRDVIKANKIMDYMSKDVKNNPLIKTVTVLYEYFAKLIIIHSLSDKSSQNIASSVGIPPFYVKEYLAAVDKYSLSKLKEIISYLRDIDLKSKGFNINTINTDDLSKELIYKILH